MTLPDWKAEDYFVHFEPIYFENRIVTKGGETRWVAWTATPLLSEGIIIASHRDITAQKEAAEALKISNERYEFIKNAANEAIWDWDLSTNVIWGNDAFSKIFNVYTINQYLSLHCIYEPGDQVNKRTFTSAAATH